MCKSPKSYRPNPPAPAPVPPKETTAATQAAVAAQAQRSKENFGQKATIMTGGQGMNTKATGSQKKLLSGTV